MTILERFRLDNRVALVTGGNRGLGRQMAQALAEAGADLALVSRVAAEVGSAADHIAAATGRTCRGYACDVTDEARVAGMVAQVVDDFGQIDILVNNAGINIRAPIEELSLEEFRRVQDTNVTGPWLLCRAVAPHMKQRGFGRVINIGSTLSLISMADRTPYATSKGGILQMTRTLGLEWAQSGITVNAVLPGPFATEMNLAIKDDPEVYQEFLKKIPMGRWGELDEIGGIVVFLASDAASFITAASITVDGGWTAW